MVRQCKVVVKIRKVSVWFSPNSPPPPSIAAREKKHLQICFMGVWYQDKDMISRERCSMKFCTGWLDKSALPGYRLCFALELNSCYAVTSLFCFFCQSELLQYQQIPNLWALNFPNLCGEWGYPPFDAVQKHTVLQWYFYEAGQMHGRKAGMKKLCWE